jgi:TRAP-type C4-dicarboxylate transport system permease small subunit
MNQLITFLRAILFLLLVSLVATVSIGVFYRYALSRSLFWATEVPNFLFVWIVFLGAVVAYHDKKHIALTALLDRMSAKSRTRGEILVHLLVLCLAIFLIVTGGMVVLRTLDSLSEALKMPLGYLYSVVPFAFTMIAIESITSIWRLAHKPSDSGDRK